MSEIYENEYSLLASGAVDSGKALGETAVGKVFGYDNREPVKEVETFPYSAVWPLRIEDDQKSYFGTGFMVKPGVMLTAGHNIYNCDNKKYYDKIYAVDRNGMDHQVYEVFVPEEYKASKSSIYDWAVVKVGVMPGETYPCIKMINPDDKKVSPVVGQIAEIAGFPYKVNNNTTDDMYSSEGGIEIYNQEFKLLFYEIDTSGGDSGSPVIIYNYLGACVIGIHVGSMKNYNIARAIDNQIMDAVKALYEKE